MGVIDGCECTGPADFVQTPLNSCYRWPEMSSSWSLGCSYRSAETLYATETSHIFSTLRSIEKKRLITEYSIPNCLSILKQPDYYDFSLIHEAIIMLEEY